MSGSNVTHVRIPSLELNWLPMSVRKGLPTPRVIFASREWGGRYCSTRRDCGRYIDPLTDIDCTKRGLIEINGEDSIWEGSDLLPGAIAHEYRHHEQQHSWRRFYSSVFQCRGDYRASIVAFFRGYPQEMDALRFQLRVAPDDLSRQWQEWLA